MFLLRELPNSEELQKFAEKFSNMDSLRTITCLELLKTASECLMKLEKYFLSYSLSQSKFLVMIVIERSEKEALSSAEIARKMGISKKNISRLLSSMEESKLLIRTEHKEDKRITLISLSEKGKTVLYELLPGYYELINTSMKGLKKEELNSFSQSLKTMLLNLDE